MERQQGPHNRHVLIRDNCLQNIERLKDIISQCKEIFYLSKIESAASSTEAIDMLRYAQNTSNDFSLLIYHIDDKPDLTMAKELAKILIDNPELQLILLFDEDCLEWGSLICELARRDQFMILNNKATSLEFIQAFEVMTAKWSFSHNLNEMIMESHEQLERTTSQLTLKQGQLLQAQKLESIGELAAGIAHEINTPIQYIGDNIQFLGKSFEDLQRIIDSYEALRKAAEKGEVRPELLKMTTEALEDADYEFLTEEIPQAAQEALSGIDAVKKIVLAMKAFSHPGDSKQLININELIRNIFTISRNVWKYSAVIDLDLEEDLPPVPALSGELNQVFLNIVVNAVHAIEEAKKESGLITLSSRMQNEHVILKISDNGAGIKKENLERVFDPFFTTKEIGVGTGQGLHISRSVIVEKHGGTLEVESNEGVGTTFIIRLPHQGDSQ
jgi:signal transduction histidine kinase